MAIDIGGWVASDSKDNALATATKAAVSDRQHAIFSVDASFSATVSGALVQIKDGTTVVWEGYVYDQLSQTFPKGITGTKGNAMSAELAASGAGGTVGKINIHGITF